MKNTISNMNINIFQTQSSKNDTKNERIIQKQLSKIIVDSKRAQKRIKRVYLKSGFAARKDSDPKFGSRQLQKKGIPKVGFRGISQHKKLIQKKKCNLAARGPSNSAASRLPTFLLHRLSEHHENPKK